MACTPCKKRRQMLADAQKAAGIKGVVKAIPAVIRDTVKNPPTMPTIRSKRTWGK